MTRAVALVLNRFEMPRVVLPSLSGLRASFARASKLNADAANIMAANDAIRRSSRGWMI